MKIKEILLENKIMNIQEVISNKPLLELVFKQMFNYRASPEISCTITSAADITYASVAQSLISFINPSIFRETNILVFKQVFAKSIANGPYFFYKLTVQDESYNVLSNLLKYFWYFVQ